MKEVLCGVWWLGMWGREGDTKESVRERSFRQWHGHFMVWMEQFTFFIRAFE